MQQQVPGDPRKCAAVELPNIRRYLRTECYAGLIITRSLLSHLFDLIEDEAAIAIEALIREGMLVRDPERGNAPEVPETFPPQ